MKKQCMTPKIDLTVASNYASQRWNKPSHLDVKDTNTSKTNLSFDAKLDQSITFTKSQSRDIAGKNELIEQFRVINISKPLNGKVFNKAAMGKIDT